MLRKRRIEVRIEREEISVIAGSVLGAPPGEISEEWLRAAVARGSGLLHIKPDCCVVCGSCELMLLQEAVVMGAFSVAGLQQGVRSGGYHLQKSTSGEWWVCGVGAQTR